jgi:vancomycin permeability regulator SanA
MHARPQVKEILIAKKMHRWVLISNHPTVDRSCSTARARKNYQRLFYRYRELAAKIGLHEWSAFG